jgi:hypothetical protein
MLTSAPSLTEVSAGYTSTFGDMSSKFFSSGESLHRSRFCLGGFNFAISRRRVGIEGLEKVSANRGDVVDRSLERGFVCFRGLVESRDFSYELERSGADFVWSDRRFEIEKRLDVATHGSDPCDVAAFIFSRLEI